MFQKPMPPRPSFRATPYLPRSVSASSNHTMCRDSAAADGGGREGARARGAS